MTYTRADAETFAKTQRWGNDPIAQTVIDWICAPDPHPNEVDHCPICGAVTEHPHATGAIRPCDGLCRQRYYRGSDPLPGRFPHAPVHEDDDARGWHNYRYGSDQ